MNDHDTITDLQYSLQYLKGLHEQAECIHENMSDTSTGVYCPDCKLVLEF